MLLPSDERSVSITHHYFIEYFFIEYSIEYFPPPLPYMDGGWILEMLSHLVQNVREPFRYGIGTSLHQSCQTQHSRVTLHQST